MASIVKRLSSTVDQKIKRKRKRKRERKRAASRCIVATSGGEWKRIDMLPVYSHAPCFLSHDSQWRPKNDPSWQQSMDNGVLQTQAQLDTVFCLPQKMEVWNGKKKKKFFDSSG